jgi:hypothetical protein
LLRGVEKARVGVPSGRLVIGAHVKGGPIDNNVQMEVLFDGDKRRLRYESPNFAKIRTMSDGKAFLRFDRQNSVTISDPATWQPGDFLLLHQAIRFVRTSSMHCF